MSFTSIIIVLIYLMVLAFLGWKGYRSTKTASDYLVAGRGVHPYIMAMSFGATFISTSAIIGFGGTAGVFGLGVLWLTFLNIFVGIFIAFVFFGKRTRTMGHHLNAHTFPELLGRRYQSKFLQVAGGVVILSMVVYAAAVLTSACRSLEGMYNIDYNVALALIAVIVTAYVITGGLKGVMYTDALQGTIMFVGMVLFLIMTFSKLGGVSEAHKKLEETYDKAYT
ncbi:MAG: sodium:solute symporter, partial [Spirochaetae bacterium HGW-Spirochaetae-6]